MKDIHQLGVQCVHDTYAIMIIIQFYYKKIKIENCSIDSIKTAIVEYITD